MDSSKERPRTPKHVALDVHQATTVASLREETGRVIAGSVLRRTGPTGFDGAHRRIQVWVIGGPAATGTDRRSSRGQRALERPTKPPTGGGTRRAARSKTGEEPGSHPLL